MSRRRARKGLGTSDTDSLWNAQMAISEFELAREMVKKGDCRGAIGRALIAAEDGGRAKGRGMGTGEAIWGRLEQERGRTQVVIYNFCLREHK